MGIKTILWAFGFAAGCGLSLFNPIWGVVTYMLVYQLDPTDRWWGMPLHGMGVRFSLYAAVATMLGLIFGAGKLPRFRTAISYWEIGALLLLGIAVVNIAAGVGFGATAQHELEKFIKVVVFTLLLARIACTWRNLLAVLWTLVLGSLCIGYDALTAPAWGFVQGRLEIIGGPDFSTTSGAASHLTAMLPIIGAMLLICRPWWQKLLAASAGALTVNAIIMCRTRSAFIGLLVGAAAAVLAAPRTRRLRIYGLLGLGLLGGFSLTDEHFWQRMRTLTDRQVLDNDLAAVSRREIWLASVRMIGDYPFGIGVGNFTTLIGEYDPRHYKRSTHNSLIVCLVELGIPGGLIFISMVGGSIYLLHQSVQVTRSSGIATRTAILSYGLLVSLVTYSVTALGTQRFYCESFWWVLVLPLCLRRLIEVESRAARGLAESQPRDGGLPGGVLRSLPA